MTKVLDRFGMEGAKLVNSTWPTNFKLNKDQSLKMEAEKAEMSRVPYASAVGSLMYAIICTRLDKRYAVGVFNRYMRNTRREHLVVVKWILQYLKGTSSMCL